MEKQAGRRWKPWLAALIGAAVGVASWPLVRPSYPNYGFLDGAPPLTVTPLARSHDMGYVYAVPHSMAEVLGRAKRELGFVIDRSQPSVGKDARLLTVPRFDGGRVLVASIPDRQILLVPGRSWVDQRGAVRYEPSSAEWTTVEVVVFRRAGFVEGIRG